MSTDAGPVNSSMRRLSERVAGGFVSRGDRGNQEHQKDSIDNRGHTDCLKIPQVL